tara:strand:+ start:2551 stop:2802 length:252 start_codon:yes stop_codon:yes gene_type:complete
MVEGTFTSTIMEQGKFLDSKSYNNLSPKMKLAVQDTFKMIESATGNVIEKFEGSVEKVAEIRDVNKQDLMDYFEKETDELLGE